MPYRAEQRDDYPHWIGLIFVFNLIVGTGALTLPAVFKKAGWALSFVVVTFLAFISYMTVTFVIETMACANAVMHWRRLQFLKRDRALQHNNISENYDNDNDDDEDGDENGEYVADGTDTDAEGSQNNASSMQFTANLPSSIINVANSIVRSRRHSDDSDAAGIEHTPLFSQRSRYYVLDNKVELGEMAGLFFNDFGRIIFYLCISIYLYGDLSIYTAAVSKTMRDVLCTANGTNNGSSDSLDADPCWEKHTLSRLDVYRLSIIGFIMLLGPFTFFNVQKTKYIQMFTALLRWLAFTIMIGFAINRLIVNGATGHPPAVDLTGLPSLFGASVYSFMCHHSLPSLLSPVSDKKRIKTLMSTDYILICTFYLLLAMTGIFAFENLEDLYTLNFVPNPNQKIALETVDYFLTLFPVFTLTTSYPIIAITLRNNLQTLFLDMSRFDSYNLFQRRLIFPLLAITPPVCVTYFTESLTSLVSFTGSYAGTAIQYIVPCALVYSARKTCTDLLGQGIINEYRSPFKSNRWLLFVLFWSCACIILVTVNFFTSVKNVKNVI